MCHSNLLPFYHHLQARGLAPSTGEQYAYAMSRLQRYAGVPVDAITSQHARDHLVDQTTRRHVSASWYNIQFCAIVRWFEFRGLTIELRGLQPQRRHLSPPRSMTFEELGRLFEHLDNQRYRLCCLLCYATGIRISELVAIQVSDLQRNNPLLRIRRGKGGNGRDVIIPPTLRALLLQYWRTWRPTDFFFERRPGHDRRPLLAETLRAAFRSACDTAQLPPEITFHCLRHSFGRHSIMAGVDIVVIQHLMGHRSILSTLRYLTPDMRHVDPIDIDLLTRFDPPKDGPDGDPLAGAES